MNGQLSTQNKTKLLMGDPNQPPERPVSTEWPTVHQWVNEFIYIRKYAFYEFNDFFFPNLEGPVLFHRGFIILRENFESKAHQNVRFVEVMKC